MNPTAPLEFSLQFPVTHDGKIYNSLFINRIKGKTLLEMNRTMQSNPEAADFALYAAMCGVPVGVIEEMDADDFIDMTEVAKPFLPRKFRELSGQDQASEAPSASSPTDQPAKRKTTGQSAPTGESGTPSQQR
jgi:hypothetical protein